MKHKLVFVVGPTASGKTDLAIKIAKQLNCEIISADSRQFYKALPIGTAMPSEEELSQVAHHFIGHLELNELWSAQKFADEALKLIKKDPAKPWVIVGGSGFYLHALEYQLDDIPKAPDAIREQLNQELQEQGLQALVSELEQVDPKSYRVIDTQNPQRVIRALEVYRHTQKPFSEFKGKEKPRPEFEIFKIGIQHPREALYQRINERVVKMLGQGLIEEVKAALPFRRFNSLNTVGYKELLSYFDGEISLETAIEEIKKNTRRFAKRQVTWNNRYKDIHWVPSNYSMDSIITSVKNNLKLP